VTSDFVAGSKIAEVAGPAGRTVPAGGRVAAGDTAAEAGGMVGGGVSADFDVQAVTVAARMTSTPQYAI
jgi:hypothetical protein